MSGQVAGLAAAVTFGASAPFTALLAGGASPVRVAGLLYAGAALVLLPVASIRLARGRARLPGWRDLGTLALITVLGGMIGPVLLVVGLERLSSSQASLLLNLEAVATAAVGALVFREHLGRRGWSALMLVVLGGIVLVGAPHGSGDHWGMAAVVGACLCWGIDNNLSRAVSLNDVFVVAGLKSLGAAVPMLALSTFLPTAGTPGVAGLLVVGAIGYGVSIGLDLYALRHLGSGREAVLFAAAPFIGAVVGVALGAPLGTAGVVAGVVMATGIALLLREEHEHQHCHERLDHEHWHRHDDDHHHHEHPPGLRIVEGRRGQHLHRHVHDELVHTHRHVPDVHHRHRHGD